MRLLPLLMLLSAPGIAMAQTLLTPAAYIERPDIFTGKSLKFNRLQCVDIPSGSFTCLIKVGGRFLKFDALRLGEATTASVAEHIIAECTGTMNIDRKECLFDVTVTPQTVARDVLETTEGSVPVITVFAREIDFSLSRRK